MSDWILSASTISSSSGLLPSELVIKRLRLGAAYNTLRRDEKGRDNFGDGLCFAGGCTPRLPSPAINSATTAVDFPGCRNTSLNFNNLNPENFKSMVTCLNGQSGAIQPYKDFVDSMDEKDLGTLLEVFNHHFFLNPKEEIKV